MIIYAINIILEPLAISVEMVECSILNLEILHILGIGSAKFLSYTKNIIVHKANTTLPEQKKRATIIKNKN